MRTLITTALAICALALTGCGDEGEDAHDETATTREVPAGAAQHPPPEEVAPEEVAEAPRTAGAAQHAVEEDIEAQLE